MLSLHFCSPIAGPRSAIGRAPDSSGVRYPVWQHTFVSPSAFSRRAVVSYWRKYVHEVLVNRLGGLSLPRKSVVRLTDRPDMTGLDFYRGRKTTIQQQQICSPITHYFMTENSFDLIQIGIDIQSLNKGGVEIECHTFQYKVGSLSACRHTWTDARRPVPRLWIAEVRGERR